MVLKPKNAGITGHSFVETTNVQGQLINSDTGTYGNFIHLEIESSVRNDETRYERVSHSFDDIQTEANWISGTDYAPDAETIAKCNQNINCDVENDLTGIFFQTPLTTQHVDKMIMPYYTNIALENMIKVGSRQKRRS